MALSQWLVNELLGSYFTPDRPAKTYNRFNLCLLRSPALLGSLVAQMDEPYGVGGYQRVLLPFSKSAWKLSGFREVVNANDITFPVATGTWGTVTAWALISAEFGTLNYGPSAKIAAGGPLALPVKVSIGTQVLIGAGTLGLGLYDGA